MPGVFSNTAVRASNSGSVAFIYVRKNVMPTKAAQLLWIELVPNRNQ